MSSMDWPFSSFFSISTMSFTPSTTSCTCSTSDEPSRSALDMSNTEPTAAVSTPPAGAEGRGISREQRCRNGAQDAAPVPAETAARTGRLLCNRLRALSLLNVHSWAHASG
uniref:Uncharacterized protein n=1 Tax=Neovison vison TaxID=452646 RepID=A0A8C7ALS2_NEOVI